jgi:DhnA family fructose-bisphosphate aldolase class Ia
MSTRTIRVCDYGDRDHEATTMLAVGFDGVVVRVDVCDQHKKEISEAVKPIIEAGETLRGATKATFGPIRKKRTRAEKPHIDPDTAKKMREFAATIGMEVSPRGNVPQKLVDAYRKAHTE